MFHWTDQKIRVHVFYCVLALTVARLMVREADRHGLHLSVRELLDTLAGIQETVLLYQGERGRPRARRMLTEIDPTARRLYDLFGLDTYAPTAMTTTTTTVARRQPGLPSKPPSTQRRPVQVSYHGHQRIVCPHALGWKTRPAHAPRLPDRRTHQHRNTPRRPPTAVAVHVHRRNRPRHHRRPHPANGQTADNYNPAHPFPAIDHVTIAITPSDNHTSS